MKNALAALILSVLACGAAADDTGRRAFLVRTMDTPDLKRAVDTFRAKGYRVDVWHETETSKHTHNVIAIGSDVEAAQAIEAIRLAREVLPALRYVFIQEDPQYANHIYVGASSEWIKTKNLKPLTAKDFQGLGAGNPSNAELHVRVRRFGL